MLEFGHVGIPVKDLEGSIDFYKSILECEFKERFEFDGLTLVFLEGGGTIIELISKPEYTENRPNPSPIDHIAFNVDDIDVMHKRVVDAGYEVLVAPKPLGGSRIMFFLGPNNEKIEFCEGKF